MPIQTGKSAIFAKLGAKAKQAHEKHKKEPVTYGNPSLPDGIENGIAELRQCKFGIYKDGKTKGQAFFMAAGIVKSPAEHNGVPIAGLRTQIGPEPLCDTPEASGKRKTFDDHYGWMLNELKKLGVNAEEVGPDDLEATAAALEKAGIHFRFRTWKGKKQTTGPYAGQEPRVNHEWNGVVEDYQDAEGQDGGAVEDGTPPSDQVAEETGGDEGGAVNPEDDDLDALAEQAQGEEDPDNAPAQQRLMEIATEAGVSDDEMGAADNWAAVVELIRTAQAGGEAHADEPAAPADPVKGELYKYKPLDPKDKTKKKRLKAVECEVTSVNKLKKTVGLTNMDNKKIVYKDVPWSELEAS